MLEHYYVRPDTVDRVRSSWIGKSIERYVEWLTENGYTSRSILRRIPRVMEFGKFAQQHGATKLEELPEQIEKFTLYWFEKHGQGCKTNKTRRKVLADARTPVEQMLDLVIPGCTNKGRVREPFQDLAPNFFDYLQNERGIKESTLVHYRYDLCSFENYLQKIGLYKLDALSPVNISGFITDSRRLCKTSLGRRCSSLRTFFRYLYRERIIVKDLGITLDSPRVYRLSNIPRSITWDEVNRMLV